MPRTTGRWESDGGFGDALAWIGVNYWQFNATTAPTYTRNAQGNYSWACAASQTITCAASLSNLNWQRTGYKITDQEQYGGAYGPGPAAGNPPFTGATQLTPLAAFIPKGIEIADITLVYSIGTAALTSQALSLNKLVYANAAAVAVTQITLSTATALATVSATTLYATKIAVSAPAYLITDLTELTIENTVTAGSGVYNLYGAFIHATFNNQ